VQEADLYDYKAALAKSYSRAMELFQMGEAHWKHHDCDHDDMTLATLHSEDATGGSGHIIRVVGLVRNIKFKDLFETVYHQTMEEKKRLSPGQDFLLEDHVVEELKDDDEGLGEHYCVRHQVFKLKWPLHHRESVTVRGGKRVPGDPPHNCYIQWETSVLHDKHPEVSSPVRAQVYVACYFFEEINENTRVTYIADVSMGGNIPTWVLTLASGKACERLLSFRRLALELYSKPETLQ
jgi:hypothetical protein